MTLKDLQKALYNCYAKDLCYPSVQKSWSEENKCLGMCAITALLIQDYLGGNIAKIYVDNVSHYFNMINNEIIDLTASQFSNVIDYSNSMLALREQMLKNENTSLRYHLLKERVTKELLQEIDKRVHNCFACKNLVEKFPNASTVFLGENNDIVLVGEAPANNGWRKSGMLWKDVTGKVLPSGVVLQKLFSILDRDIFKTTFLEAVKCYPLERRNLKVCSLHCKEILMEQLQILSPKLVIPLGEFPTRVLLGNEFTTFKDVVGKIYEVGSFKVLPIYHPSPISPKSYKGNVPIIDALKESGFCE